MIKHDAFTAIYKPDVLSCLADLSNDEVFTPPDVANKMLDMLPQELFRDPNTKFLDPACKSGVFLREIAKRLIAGEADKIPDLQERCDHIFKEQLFGIAITELTSLLSRRSVYCTKYANSPFAITRFDKVDGNIVYHKTHHTWDKKDSEGHCIYCGTSFSGDLSDTNREGLESHAYEFIHTLNPEEIFNMKFDVIVSNPPYQLDDNGAGTSARPIYQLFVQQAKKLNPRYITMITPSRWFNGGKGLDSFRSSMLNDGHITKLIDYQNAKDCFPGVSISGGVSYFLWERDRTSECEITNIVNNKTNTRARALNEFPTFIRYNSAVDIISKVRALKEKSVVSMISARNPFGFPTNFQGSEEKTDLFDTPVQTSHGKLYVSHKDITQGNDYIDKYKIMISRFTSEHAGEPDKDGKYKVLSKMEILCPGEVCTDTYILAAPSYNKEYTDNVYGYFRTNFVRFLILQALSSINLTRERYEFVPVQDFSKPWSDDELYKKYNLSQDEINFIESMIKPMD